MELTLQLESSSPGSWLWLVLLPLFSAGPGNSLILFGLELDSLTCKPFKHTNQRLLVAVEQKHNLVFLNLTQVPS